MINKLWSSDRTYPLAADHRTIVSLCFNPFSSCSVDRITTRIRRGSCTISTRIRDENSRITSRAIGLHRENAIAIESEARYPNGGNMYYVTMQITFHIPEIARKERNLHCDVVHITTVWIYRLVLDHAIAVIQTS